LGSGQLLAILSAKALQGYGQVLCLLWGKIVCGVQSLHESKQLYRQYYYIVRSSAIVFERIKILNHFKSQKLECNTNQRESEKKDQLVSLFNRKMKYKPNKTNNVSIKGIAAKMKVRF
jgi:hypothetical protein